ncbi:MAG: hypothetical protein ACYS9Y_07655 [Planctomycetota bacterium]|jgi:hypothetical protein
MAEENITVLAKLKAKDGLTQIVKQKSMELVGPTRSEARCIVIHVKF